MSAAESPFAADEAAVLPWLQPAWERFETALGKGRQPHALLLDGPPGIGKRALGLAMAAALLCEQSTACGRCPACQWHVAGNHPDWYPVSVDDGKQTIGVDSLRALMGKLSLASLGGGRKVVMIDPADAMTTGASNSLLKTLEEPPGDTVLILVCHRLAALPATIVSRCQRLGLPRPPSVVALEWLQSRDVASASELLDFSGGSPLRALALAPGGEREEEGAFAAEIGRDLASLLEGGDPLAVAARWQKQPLTEVLDWLYRLTAAAIRMRLGQGGSELAHKLPSGRLPAGIEALNLHKLFQYLDLLVANRRRAETALNRQLVMETLLIPWTTRFAGELPTPEASI